MQRLLAGGDGPAHVLYPQAGRANGAGHHNLAWEVGTDSRFRPSKGGWYEVAHEIAVERPKIAFVSSEAFEFKRPARVLTTIATVQSGVIDRIDGLVYLRPHASRLLSSFAERVKRGIAPFDRAAFLDLALSGARFRYMQRIDRWRKHLAPGRLEIRVFHPSTLRRGDIVSDVFETVLQTSPPLLSGKPHNIAPSAMTLLMMQMQGAAFTAASGPQTARARARAIQSATGTFGDGPRPQWSKAEAERIRTACRADALALDTLLGGTTFVSALNEAVDMATSTAFSTEPMMSIMAQTAIAAARLPPQLSIASEPRP